MKFWKQPLPVLTEAIFGSAICLALIWLAQHAAIRVLGEHLSRMNLVAGLASTVASWSDWSADGAKLALSEGDTVRRMAFTVLWSVCVLRAGSMSKGEFRAPWMLGALAGIIAAIGFGDLATPVLMFAAVAITRALTRLLRDDGKALGPLLTVKPALTALGLAGIAAAGTPLVWRGATFAGPPPDAADTLIAYAAAFATGLGTAFAAVKLIEGRKNIRITGSVAVALLSGALVFAPKENRNASAEAVSRIFSTGAERRLRATLADYRQTAHDAAADRFDRAELTTKRALLPDLIALAENIGDRRTALWLKADNALMMKPGPDRLAAIKEALDYSATILPCATDPCLPEMRAWLLLESRRHTEAAESFRKAAFTTPGNAPAWHGLAIALAWREDYSGSIEALAEWFACEPRALFSPELRREPLLSVWPQAVTELESRAQSPGAGRIAAYLAAAKPWFDPGRSTRDIVSEKNFPPARAGAVAQIRERLLETKPGDALVKPIALFSAGVALVTDRHIVNGQGEKLWEAWRDDSGEAPAIPGIRPLISRPLMTGWEGPTEGGVGGSLGDFEEDPFARLLFYGKEGERTGEP